MFKDGRGANSTKKSQENRKKIKEWIESNPNGTKAECCRSLGISFTTLQKHIKALKGYR